MLVYQSVVAACSKKPGWKKHSEILCAADEKDTTIITVDFWEFLGQRALHMCNLGQGQPWMGSLILQSFAINFGISTDQPAQKL